MERDVVLRIVVQGPPAAVDYGLQKGRGSNYETVQKQRSDGSDLSFEFSVGVKVSSADLPDFTGPFVQGPPGQRFVYLDIGTLAGQAGSNWSRRLKVPLTGIAWEALESRSILEALVPGKAKDGGPSCATVKPWHGWRNEDARS